MSNGRTGMLGAASRGLERGGRIGLMFREQASREESRAMQQDLTRLQVANSILSNKNMPDSVKLETFNKMFVPLFNKIFASDPDDPLSTEGQLSALPQWNNKIANLVKRGTAIVTDKTLNTEQRRAGIRGLMVEAQGDVDLAPMLEEVKAQGVKQQQADTLAAFEILKSGGGVSDDEVEKWLKIKARNPKSILEASKLVQEQRKAAPKPTKLTVRTEGGRDKIVMLVDGQIQQFDLGATDEEKRFNGQQFRARLIMRINGLKTGDAFFDKKIDANKARTMLDDWNKSDPFLSFMQRLTGTPTEPSTGAQEEADAFFKEQ